MKKILKRANSKETKRPSATVAEEKPNVHINGNMTGSVVKKFDDLIRCTNVLTEGIETEFLKFVAHQEHCRKKWLSAEEENHDMKKYMAKYKGDKDTLEVKLKMARHQLDTEMKKRIKAEQSVDHMARQLQLIKELLLDKDSGSQLSLADKQALAESIHQYNPGSNLRSSELRSDFNQSYTLDESSFDLPPSEYDNTDDDILDVTGGSMLGNSRRKSHKRHRPSAPPLAITDDTTSTENEDYIKRTKVTEEVHKTIETHVRMSESPSKYTTERLDKEFPRPPTQSRRPPTRQHLKEFASTGELTTDYDMDGCNKENSSTPRHYQPFLLTRHQQHVTQQETLPSLTNRKTLTKQNTVPSLYPNLQHLSSPETKTKFNTLSTPNSARRELAHSFVTKITLKMETCTQCGKKLRFYSSVAKCKNCKAVCHLECQKDVSSPCFPTKDTPGGKRKEGTIEAYVNAKQSVKVPGIVVQCIDEIERRGMKELGLYRVPGMDKDVKELKEKFLRGKNPDLAKYRDVHVICGCLKDFVRGLSEPLVTYYLHESFMVAAGLTDDDDSLSAMYQCVSELPQANRDTLAALMLHLQKVSHSPKTQMGAGNLAKVFGPTIVGHRSANPTHMEMLEDIRSQPIVVTRLLEMPSDYWNQFSSNAPSHAKTPPYNPNYFSATPTTPDLKPPPESLLGSIEPNSQSGARLRKTYNAMTPKVVSKDPKRHRHFFNSPQ